MSEQDGLEKYNFRPFPNRTTDYNIGFREALVSQQAEVDRLKNENIDLSLAVGMEKKANELLEARIRDLEAEAEALRTSFTIVEADLVAELEARKKALEEQKRWLDSIWATFTAIHVGYGKEDMTDEEAVEAMACAGQDQCVEAIKAINVALEATLPKGGNA